MNKWSFDITRQSAWDWWVLVCVMAALVLLCYASFGRLWQRGKRGLVALTLICIGVGGTVVVVGLGEYRTARIGLFWTFILLSLLSATFYLELIDRLGRRRSMTLLILRIVALAMAVPMLFEPVLRYVTHQDPRRRPLLILVDTSGSMSFPDIQNGPTRIQSVWLTVSTQLNKLNAHFVPRYFTFDSGFKKLENAEALAKIPADGKSTNIALGINKTLSQVTDDNTAVAIITDGIDNTSPDVIKAVESSRLPIHTLRVGSEQTESKTLVNIAVGDVKAPEDFIVNHESTVDITINATALPNRIIEVKMAEVDANGKQTGQVAVKKLPLKATQVSSNQVSLPYTPTTAGVHTIAVWVDPVPGERSIVDNRQEFQGLAIDPRMKVLYIEGAARPEYGVLNRLFLVDPNVEWSTYLQLQQAKAEVHGSVDGAAFLSLPNSPQGWRKFDVILIGDVPARFFSAAQQDAIEQAVLNGSALFMIGGINTLGPGGYQGTAMERALPVLVGPPTMPQEMAKFVPRLTAAGAVHPTMEGLSDFFGIEENPGTKELDMLRGNVVVAGAKPGAEILLVHKDKLGTNGKPQIVLAVQRYGKGRSAVFTGDTTNYWKLRMHLEGQDSPFNRFWGQIVQWLAGTEVRNRQKGGGIDGLLPKKVYQQNEPVHLRAMVRDELGYATRFAQVTLKLKRAGSADEKTITLNPVSNRVGMYEAEIPQPGIGDWTAELSAAKNDKPLGKQELKFTVIPPADDEMLKLAANPALLIQIADVTHGTHRELQDFSKLLDELIAQEKTLPDKETAINLCNFVGTMMILSGHEPTWDRKMDLPMQAGLVFALLAAEWILRRVWQLT